MSYMSCGNRAFFKKKTSVAAASVVERAPFSSHSNICLTKRLSLSVKNLMGLRPMGKDRIHLLKPTGAKTPNKPKIAKIEPKMIPA